MAIPANKTIVDIGTAHECVKHDHDAFGKITLSAVSSSKDAPMFGSSVGHRNFMSIELARASLTRHLNRDWIREGDSILRASMSNSQWAQFVASVGLGAPTPITLERAPRRGTTAVEMPDFEADSLRDTFDTEIDEAISEARACVRAAQEQLRSYLAPGAKAPSKKELYELKMSLRHAGDYLAGTASFIQTSFAEAVEDSVEAAKADVEAFVGTVAMNTGLHALRDGAEPVLLERLPEAE